VHNFRQAKYIKFESVANGIVSPEMIVLGVEINGHFKAYPETFLTYRHIIRDNLGGTPILVTFAGAAVQAGYTRH